MRNAICCRTRGTVSTAMLESLASSSAKSDATHNGQPLLNQVWLAPTTDVYRTTPAGAL
jgi:hypothetical protein